MLVLVDLTDLLGRGAGAVERGGLENRCPSYGDRGFESLPLRHGSFSQSVPVCRRKVAPFAWCLVEDDPPTDDCRTATHGFGETLSVLCLEDNGDDNTPRHVAKRRS